ncbi:hypothetical protein GCM10020229_25400 [Kitasatospora albolonga]
MTGQSSGGTHHVVVLALENVLALDLGIPWQTFGSWPDGPYTLSVCSERPGPVQVHGGPALHVAHGLDRLASADTVIVPGYEESAAPSTAVTDALAEAAARGTRVASICTGVFALAAAGLLDGRRATTHWLYARELARRYPRVTVVPGELYVDEGQVLTSGGVSAGLDLCLHLIRRDHGPLLANRQARMLVAAPHRTGGQAQFIDLPVRPRSSADPDPLRLGAAQPPPASHRRRVSAPGRSVPADTDPPLPRGHRPTADALAARRPAGPRPRTPHLRRPHGRSRRTPLRPGHPRQLPNPLQGARRGAAAHLP